MCRGGVLHVMVQCGSAFVHLRLRFVPRSESRFRDARRLLVAVWERMHVFVTFFFFDTTLVLSIQLYLPVLQWFGTLNTCCFFPAKQAVRVPARDRFPRRLGGGCMWRVQALGKDHDMSARLSCFVCERSVAAGWSGDVGRCIGQEAAWQSTTWPVTCVATQHWSANMGWQVGRWRGAQAMASCDAVAGVIWRG